ncbi:MAG TPA: 2-C-methyl-D-erythritol 4-phosphate cytidylyltransferase [bacterium]|nr:2-C-methyl-D-erythritol 4-phosphate cytidylyltransferase [bacterium]
MNTYAVIPSAGLGKRFGAQKQFLEIAGKPVLIHTLQAFEDAPSVSLVCVVAPEAEIASVREMIVKFGMKKARNVVAGGKERQDSVRLGFEALPPCDIVVVHDGVRPLVTSDIIEKTIAGAQAFGGCVAALPAKETTKKVNADGAILETVDRSQLWNIQTPQAFRRDIFRRAVEKSVKDGFLGTDEAMLVERLGETVKVVTSSPYNIKITAPEDLAIAEAFLKLR